jgi:hypothetical protein
MIYDEPGEVIRRYGKTGYKVIACKADGKPNSCLQQFFRHGGDWTMYDIPGEDDSCGGNCISWEIHGDVVYLENDYTGCKAKIKRDTLLAVINNLRTWLGLDGSAS